MKGNPWRNCLITYRQYKDDHLFVWQGSEEDFKLFTTYLNDNTWGLSFSGEICTDKIDYLDVTLSSENEKVITKNFFKKVVSNCFLKF